MNHQELLRLPQRAIRATEKADFHINALALGSSGLNTAKACDRILDWSEWKVGLINLKCIIESVVRSLNKRSREILSMRFFECMEIEEIIAAKKISLRTYFRHMEAAEGEFVRVLELRGVTEEYLTRHYHGNPLVNLRLLCRKKECNKRGPKKRTSIEEFHVPPNVPSAVQADICIYQT